MDPVSKYTMLHENKDEDPGACFTKQLTIMTKI
jgi:hypothetical protein